MFVVLSYIYTFPQTISAVYGQIKQNLTHVMLVVLTEWVMSGWVMSQVVIVRVVIVRVGYVWVGDIRVVIS